jgi:hypothetical protein
MHGYSPVLSDFTGLPVVWVVMRPCGCGYLYEAPGIQIAFCPQCVHWVQLNLPFEVL